MRVEIAGTAEQAARYAARAIAGRLREAIRERQVATLALSGGSSPLPMLLELTRLPVDWAAVHVFQVDERVAPRGDSSRNLTALENLLIGRGELPWGRVHPMWVERADLDGAATAYAGELTAAAGSPPVLDVVHLGLGTDGHTASLFPGDPALDVTDREVVVTAEHAGFSRMTLTLPVLNNARNVLWFVIGADKATQLLSLAIGTGSTPACRVSREHALIVADSAAARLLPRSGPSP